MLPVEDYGMTQRGGKEHTAIPQPCLCCRGEHRHGTRRGRWVSAALAPPHAPSLPLSSTQGMTVGPETKAALFEPRSAKQLLRAAAAASCSCSFSTGLDDAGSSCSFWPPISQGQEDEGLSSVFSSSCSQQKLGAADARPGGCALTRTLLPLPTHTKTALCHGRERREELKTTREEAVTTACCAGTRGFATRHGKTRNANLQMRRHIATRWSHSSPQQHTGISPHHQSYPGSE